MSCLICKAESVTRCYSCGALLCAEHGKSDNCGRCTSAIAAGDPRHDRVSEKPLSVDAASPWWRPQVADDYAPPACYKCQGLTRMQCRNCKERFCRDHAGPGGLCQECGRSANLGIYVAATMAVFVAIVLLWNWLGQ
jgi:hypothetical protein